MTEEQAEQLAATLAHARLLGQTIAAPEFEFGLGEAYAIQERVSAHLGSATVGWKVGSTSKEAQARLGTDEPGAGRLLERFSFATGAAIPVASAHDPFVEVEFAFRIGAPLQPRTAPYTAQDIGAAVAGFVPAMEIVGSRLQQGLSGSGRSLVSADGGANIAFVGGVEIPLPGSPDLVAHPCTLDVNGERAAAGTGARALGNPLWALTWLANHLSARGLALAAGAIVSTGTCTGLVAVKPGDRLRADFAALGYVEATLVDLSPGAG